MPVDTWVCHPTMISMELQRDVPQYMAIPWLMTWVMARTVSVREKGDHGLGQLGCRPSLGTVCGCRWVARRREQAAEASCKQCTSWLPELSVGVGEAKFQEKRKQD